MGAKPDQEAAAVTGRSDRARLVAAPDCGLGLLRRDLAVRKLSNLCAAAHSGASA